MGPMSKRRYGRAIRHVRERGGHTQAQLAELLGITRTAVTHWERDAHTPGLDMAERIAGIYGIGLERFLRLARRLYRPVAGEAVA